MEITTQYFDRVGLLKAVGRIDSDAAPQLQEAFTAITDGKRFRIVFDMSEVTFLSSAGLWALIDTQKVCKRFNRGRLVLSSVGPQIQRTVELAGMHIYFEIFETNEDAISRF